MHTEPRVMDALGHPIRRQILVLLKEQPRPVGEIAAHFPVSRPAISKHLRVLKGAGLVAFHPNGARNIFRLHPDGFAAARDFLDSFWEQALQNYQQLVQEELGEEKDV